MEGVDIYKNITVKYTKEKTIYANEGNRKNKMKRCEQNI